MELPEKIDGFIKHSIDNTLGLQIPDKSLDLKIQALERSNHILRNQYLSVLSKLNQKEEAVELARSEACMNAQAIKKFVEENQKLADECANLVGQCSKLERECSLYDDDREALMEFGNEAHERAKEAEIKVCELEEELKEIREEVKYYKHQYEMLSAREAVNEADERVKEAEIKVFELEEELKKMREELKYYKHQYEMLSGGSSEEGTLPEQKLLNTVVANLVVKNEVAKTASAFLEATSGIEACSELLKLWNKLRPETKNILSVADQIRTLQKDKEHLRINLHRAEEEVGVLAEENSVLYQENKRLKKLYNSEKRHDSSTKTKSNKRKTSPWMSSPVDRKIDFNDMDDVRCPLSPLKENSPDSKSHKKRQ